MRAAGGSLESRVGRKAPLSTRTGPCRPHGGEGCGIQGLNCEELAVGYAAAQHDVLYGAQMTLLHHLDAQMSLVMESQHDSFHTFPAKSESHTSAPRMV